MRASRRPPASAVGLRRVRVAALAAAALATLYAALLAGRALSAHARGAGEAQSELYRLRRAVASRGGRAAGAAGAPTAASTLAEPRVLSEERAAALVSAAAGAAGLRHANCSVVGNDSSMRRSGYGGRIDAAGAVYRMNFAPLAAYADDVGTATHTQCVNPEKLRYNLKSNPNFVTDVPGAAQPRVLVVGDLAGGGGGTGTGPCVESSPGGLCVTRTSSKRVGTLPRPVEALAEELLYTLQGGVGEEDSVPTTGLYCLILALIECERVSVFGIGAGTIAKADKTKLEYFSDADFRGWDGRHNVEAERTLLRVLASHVWNSPLSRTLGTIHWFNPLKAASFMNEDLLANTPCTSGIRC